jgi:hypothetical protein
MLGFLAFHEIFERYPQHAKAFPFLLAYMFVVHFMCPAYGLEIAVIRIPENLEPLMYKNIMHQEISKAIYGNAKPNEKKVIVTLFHSKEKACNTRQCKNQEEEIIVFKETF